MSKKIQAMLLGVVVCIVIAVVVFDSMERARFARAIETLTHGLQKDMALLDAEVLLNAHQFCETKNCSSDGDEFSFSRLVSPADVELAYFVGAIDGRTSVMVRIEHRNGVVEKVLAEKMRFEKAG